MTITLTLRKQKYQLEAKCTVRDALAQLNLSPETYLVLRNGELLNENEYLKDGDQVKLIAAISGGS
jgi:sulfur carrier protein ThiS